MDGDILKPTKMPEEWKANKNVFQDTYEGLAKWVNKQLDKKND